LSVRRFHAKATPKPTGPKTWAYSTMTIFDGDTEIGGYERNYPSFGEQTFEAFERNGAWYALYSHNYTASRVMSLPDCRDLGGEEPHAGGFCPVEFYVPRYKSVRRTLRDGRAIESWAFDADAEKLESGDTTDPYGQPVTVGPWRSLDVGFVAGCLWGDDSTWKLETIDLSRANEGIITRKARFGHLQLGGAGLTEAVRLYCDPPDPLRAAILQQQDWDVASGQLLDPYEL